MSENSKTAAGVAGAGAVGAIGYAAAGASAATVTSTLATVGSVVGGGMAAGITVAAAAPLAVAGAVYALFEFFGD
jgi:hypothetical protein